MDVGREHCCCFDEACDNLILTCFYAVLQYLKLLRPIATTRYPARYSSGYSGAPAHSPHGLSPPRRPQYRRSTRGTAASTSSPTPHCTYHPTDFTDIHSTPLDSTTTRLHSTQPTYHPTPLDCLTVTRPSRRPRRFPESQPGTDASDTTIVKRALFSEQLEPAFSTTKIHELPSQQLTTY